MFHVDQLILNLAHDDTSGVTVRATIPKTTTTQG
jgi:hypothetical protein